MGRLTRVSLILAFSILFISSIASAEPVTILYDSSSGAIGGVLLGRRGGIPPPSGHAVLVVEDFPGDFLHPLHFRVDPASRTIVENSRLVARLDSSPLRAGTGETRAIRIERHDPSGALMGNETGPVRVLLVPEGAPLARPRLPSEPRGEIASSPLRLRGGFCEVVIRAGEEPGEDVLWVNQIGLESISVSVRYIRP